MRIRYVCEIKSVAVFCRSLLFRARLFVTLCRLWQMDSHKVLGAGGEFADVVQFVERVRRSKILFLRAMLIFGVDPQEHEALRAQQRRPAVDPCRRALHARRNRNPHPLQPPQRAELACRCVCASYHPALCCRLLNRLMLGGRLRQVGPELVLDRLPRQHGEDEDWRPRQHPYTLTAQPPLRHLNMLVALFFPSVLTRFRFRIRRLLRPGHYGQVPLPRELCFGARPRG